MYRVAQVVHLTRVVAAAEDHAAHLMEGKFLGLDEILEAHRRAIEVGSLGHVIHYAVHQQRGSLLAETAIGAPWTLVGDDRIDVDMAVGDPEDARDAGCG